MKTKIPVFTEVIDREIVGDMSQPYNFLLEGDNLHSLKLLEKTHKGAIDVIYIVIRSILKYCPLSIHKIVRIG